MNRQIKFRVWSKILERFLSKEEYCFDFDGKLILVDIIDAEKQMVQLIAVPEQNYVVQTFVGVFDNNGKEIYEGDLLSYEFDGASYNGEFRSEILQCLYDTKEGMYAFQNSDCDFYWAEIARYTEVVGNIFQNPRTLS